MEQTKTMEQVTSTFTKKVGQTTYKVNVFEKSSVSCLMYCQRNFGIDCRKVYSSGYQCSKLVDWLFGRIEYFVSWLL